MDFNLRASKNSITAKANPADAIPREVLDTLRENAGVTYDLTETVGARAKGYNTALNGKGFVFASQKVEGSDDHYILQGVWDPATAEASIKARKDVDGKPGETKARLLAEIASLRASLTESE